ncbi:MAG: hypothetical protein AAB606_04365, partial [Patescibacteria group bacterium]
MGRDLNIPNSSTAGLPAKLTRLAPMIGAISVVIGTAVAGCSPEPCPPCEACPEYPTSLPPPVCSTCPPQLGEKVTGTVKGGILQGTLSMGKVKLPFKMSLWGSAPAEVIRGMSETDMAIEIIDGEIKGDYFCGTIKIAPSQDPKYYIEEPFRLRLLAAMKPCDGDYSGAKSGGRDAGVSGGGAVSDAGAKEDVPSYASLKPFDCVLVEDADNHPSELRLRRIDTSRGRGRLIDVQGEIDGFRVTITRVYNSAETAVTLSKG